MVRYFVAVAQELHFGRAAARLHIAQPSLSQQIRRLESQLGTALLQRTSRRVTLTPAGEVLFAHGAALLADGQRAVAATRAAAADALTVGFYGSAATTLLAPTLRAFAEHHPGVHVDLRELLFGSFHELVDGRVDVAFTRLASGQELGLELEIVELAREARVLAVPAGHPLAARTDLAFADLRGEAFVTNPAVSGGSPTRWRDEQRRHGLPGRIAARAGSLEELLTLVAAGHGVAFVPEPVSRGHPRADVRYLPIHDADPALVSLAFAPGRRRPALDAFIEIARRHADSVPPS